MWKYYMSSQRLIFLQSRAGGDSLAKCLGTVRSASVRLISSAGSAPLPGCLVSGVKDGAWCLVSGVKDGVWCLVFGAWCLVSGIWCQGRVRPGAIEDE